MTLHSFEMFTIYVSIQIYISIYLYILYDLGTFVFHFVVLCDIFYYKCIKHFSDPLNLSQI